MSRAFALIGVCFMLHTLVFISMFSHTNVGHPKHDKEIAALKKRVEFLEKEKERLLTIDFNQSETRESLEDRVIDLEESSEYWDNAITELELAVGQGRGNCDCWNIHVPEP